MYIKRIIALLAGFIIVLELAACQPVEYVRTGDPCNKIGATAKSKTGLVMVCKPPSKSDPTKQNRWRRP